jgi:hypothetical protein
MNNSFRLFAAYGRVKDCRYNSFVACLVLRKGDRNEHRRFIRSGIKKRGRNGYRTARRGRQKPRRNAESTRRHESNAGGNSAYTRGSEQVNEIRAVDISSRMRLGVYDCLYLALTEREGCQLITADDRLAKTIGFSIVTLADL